MSAEPAGRFVWPPKPVVESEPVEVVTQPPSAGFLDLIETQFLGRTGLSFDRRTRLTGWAADPQDAYCQRCGGSVGAHESDGEGCAACREKRLPWDRALRLGPYTGQIRTAVLDLKFRHWHQTGTELGRALGVRLGESLARAQIQPREAAIVPIPTHWTRRIRFGVDHTGTLARACAAETGVPIARVLARRRGPSQLQVSASARRSNVAHAFRVRRRRDLPGLVVVLDDVRTTGATLRAACRAIRSGCAVESLWVLTAGVTPSLGRRERENRPDEPVGSVEVLDDKEICRNGRCDD
jgi:predicted amidophosphoribosyltransferase